MLTTLPGPVPYDGPIDASIAFIGEAPGENEITPRKGYPNGKLFSGMAGMKFESILNRAGLLRSQVRVMNLNRFHPPGNNFARFWQDKKQTIPTQLLQDEIQLLNRSLVEMPNLKVIVTMGRQPTYVLTGKAEHVLQHQKGDKISNWRGSILHPEKRWEHLTVTDKYTIIPTLHPAGLLNFRNPKMTFPTLLDYRRALRESTTPSIPFSATFDPYPNFYDISSFFDKIKGTQIPLSVDIETKYGQISRIGFCIDPSYAISIPFINVATFEKFENDWVWPLLKEALEVHPIVGQNFSYDRRWLEAKHGIKTPNLIYDTMIAQHVLMPGLPLGLDFLCSIWTDIPYYKEEGKEVEGKILDDKEYGEYNCKDVVAPLLVMKAQMSQDLFNQRKHTFDFEMEIVNRQCTEMMKNGVLVDVPYKNAVLERAEREAAYYEGLVAEKIGHFVLLSSDDQVGKLLYDDIGLRYFGRKTKTGKYSVNEDKLKITKALHPNDEIINLVLKHRDAFYIARKSVVAAKIDKDDHIRSSYSPTEDTGRLRSGKSPMWNGFNLQNPDRRLFTRRMFVPEPGKIWIKRDLSKAELRIVAYLADETRLIDVLENGQGDVMKDVGADILEIAATKLTEEQYNTSKRIVHAADYLMGARTLVSVIRKELEIDIRESLAQKYIDNYYHKYPGIPRWHEEVFKEAKKTNGILTNPLGRERQFFDPISNTFEKSRETVKKMVAHLPQSTIGDLLNLILIDWDKRYRTCGDLLLTLYDECDTQIESCWIDKHVEELDKAFNFTFDIGKHKGVLIPWKTQKMVRWGEEI